MEITIQLLGWNSAAALAKSLPSLASIPASEAAITYIDNYSTDNSVDLVKEQLPNATILRLPHNVGYTGGHNVGFATCQTPYVLVLNPDVLLNWKNTLELLEVCKRSPHIGAIQGLLLRPDKTRIDSAGITRTLTLNGVDRGAGKFHEQNFPRQAIIDATTGACSLLRMQALRQISHGEYIVGGKAALEVFDKDFFAYKEDVDLGWRLQIAGWKNVYQPVLTGIHGRALKPIGRIGWNMWPSSFFTRLKSERTHLSLRNYVWLIVKNASLTQLLLHKPFIDVRLGVFFLISLIYWPLLPIWQQVLRGIPDMIHKRGHDAVNNHR